MQSSKVHPSSIIDPSCRLGNAVDIGPFCVIGPDVQIGDNTRLISHVAVLNSTTIGSQCTIFPNAVLGSPAQGRNVTFTTLVVGNKVVIREGVTIHLGSIGPTTIGNNCYLMANVHVAHDCQLEDDVMLVVGVGVAGHAETRRGATLGGLAGVHQHVVVGEYSFVGGGAMVTHDVLPYSTVIGNRAKTTGLNVVGLQRMGWPEDRIKAMAAAMAEYFKSGKTSEPVLSRFLEASKRGVCLPADYSKL